MVKKTGLCKPVFFELHCGEQSFFFKLVANDLLTVANHCPATAIIILRIAHARIINRRPVHNEALINSAAHSTHGASSTAIDATIVGAHRRVWSLLAHAIDVLNANSVLKNIVSVALAGHHVGLRYAIDVADATVNLISTHAHSGRRFLIVGTAKNAEQQGDCNEDL